MLETKQFDICQKLGLVGLMGKLKHCIFIRDGTVQDLLILDLPQPANSAH